MRRRAAGLSMSGQFRVPGAIEAIVLAAGAGKRLGSRTEGSKVLIEMVGETLLDRHVDSMLKAGAAYVTVVVGHERMRVQGRIETRYPAKFVGSVLSNRFAEGSAFTLHTMRHMMGGATTVLLVEGDTLYDPSLVRALLECPQPNALLVDERPGSGDRRVGLQGGQAVWLGSSAVPEHCIPVRLGPGLFKIGPAAGTALQRILEELPARADEPLDHESVLVQLLKNHPFAAVSVGDRAWVNIDTPADLDQAMDVVWPRLPRISTT